MAKCIQVVGQGVPVRMSDEDAFQVVVRDRDGQYCSKNVFRKLSGSEQLRAKLVGRQITKVETLSRQLQHGRRG